MMALLLLTPSAINPAQLLPLRPLTQLLANNYQADLAVNSLLRV
jgi:hypothetical protein